MGLFSFIKNAGAKLFNRNKKTTTPEARVETITDAERDAEKARLMEGMIKGLGLEVDYLDITVSDERVSVSGITQSRADKEKIIIALGNVNGIAQVEDNLEIAEAAVEERKKAEAKFHTVERGDSLSKIAKTYYGDAMKYKVIFEANKPMLEDPNLIYPGQVLRIPPLQA